MIPLLLIVLALWVAQTLLPPTLRYVFAGPGLAARLRIALGPRDEPPPASVLVGRAERALANLHEALPVFITLALLHVVERSEDVLPRTGAAIFLVARILYVPAYLSGVPGLRSAIWVASWVGLVAMIVALVR